MTGDCARFVKEHEAAIASARPALPGSLNDRAADIWEPLLALADLAGGEWPEKARQAAVGLNARAQEGSPIGALLLDIFIIFTTLGVDRTFSQKLVEDLKQLAERPWMELCRGKEINEWWLAKQLHPYGVLLAL